jgi:hypothetical protein
MEPGVRVRCAFGTGWIETVDTKNNKVHLKMDNGTKIMVNPQEIERLTTTGPVTMTSKTVTVTETTHADGKTVVVNVVKHA